ncbi:hypothetical protein SAMN05445060_2984 [Williamsia sterculiae]|uniref:Uncharacterized protein n=1 Tax=Williamsia sterculiae TaxID=1344003 RepID=A0A1N7GQA0_9NOCA|nr:hypothetical protein SAMN05445060_2984 [Williamsia sterculiae]
MRPDEVDTREDLRQALTDLRVAAGPTVRHDYVTTCPGTSAG